MAMPRRPALSPMLSCIPSHDVPTQMLRQSLVDQLLTQVPTKLRDTLIAFVEANSWVSWGFWYLTFITVVNELGSGAAILDWSISCRILDTWLDIHPEAQLTTDHIFEADRALGHVISELTRWNGKYVNAQHRSLENDLAPHKRLVMVEWIRVLRSRIPVNERTFASMISILIHAPMTPTIPLSRIVRPDLESSMLSSTHLVFGTLGDIAGVDAALWACAVRMHMTPRSILLVDATRPPLRELTGLIYDAFAVGDAGTVCYVFTYHDLLSTASM
jgi:hypothetical protein